MTPDDPASATLTEAERIANGLQNATRMLGLTPDFTGCGGPAAEAYWSYFTPARILSLLAAVEAVLERHACRDKPVRTHHICSAHGPLGDDEGYTEACPDCFITEKHVCATCRHTCPDDDEWPCAEYLAIRAALAGAQLSEDGELT